MEIDVPESWEQAKRLVLPVLRRATEPAHAWAAERKAPENRMVRRPFAPHLREMVVLDLPDLRMFVNQGHLEAWGVDADVALEAAHRNLASAATAGLTRREAWGLWQLDAQDGYESSRLLLPGWLGAFSASFAGPPVAAVPVQRALLIGDSGDPGAVPLLYELARRAFREGANPLSPVLYTPGIDGRPVPYASEEHRPSARFAERLLATWEYSEQAAQLSEVVDEAVAPIALHRDSELSTTVARVEELPALVPRADEVELDGERLAFEDLLEQGLLEQTDHDPTRWRITGR